MSQLVSSEDVSKIAKLANIPLLPQEVKTLTSAFKKTLEVVDTLNTLATQNIKPTSQVTGLENVFREDVVDTESMFSQEEALQNAPRSSNGFFVVDAIFNEESNAA